METKHQWEVTECNLRFTLELYGCKTLQDVEQRLRAQYPGWFIYSGAHYVALHRKSGDNQRLLLVIEN